MTYAQEAHYTLHPLKNMENLHKAFWNEDHPCKNCSSIKQIIIKKVMNLEFDKRFFYFPFINMFTIQLHKRHYLLSESSTSLFPSRSSQRASPISGDNSCKEYMTQSFFKTIFKGSKQHPPPLKNKKNKKKQKAINIKDTWQSQLILTG